MRIGLLSDTHIPLVMEELPVEVTEALRGVDLILHAGDIFSLEVLDALESIAPVYAARGDDDGEDALTDERVKERHILQLDGKTLWLVHEKPYVPRSPDWMPNWWHDRLKPERSPEKPDIVVFGHEHRTYNQHLDGVLFICPGSPTFLNYEPGPGTIGILDLDSGKPSARIIRL